MSFITKPRFPSVPPFPGVPQLVRATTQAQASLLPTAGLGIAAARLALAILAKPQWGIFKYQPPTTDTAGGVDSATGLIELQEVVVRPDPPVLLPDNIFRMGYTQAYTVTDAPVQNGSFASYNKVGVPFEVQLRMTKGGTLQERQQFLDTLEAIGASQQLFRILTPERVYQPVNITEVSLVREGEEGAFFFAECDVSFVQIREVQAQYQTGDGATALAKDPSARPVQNQGTLNTVPPTSRVQGAVNKVLAPLRAVGNLIGGT